MNDLEIKIKELENKVKNLLDLHRKTEIEKEEKKIEIEQLKDIINVQNQSIDDLKSRINIISFTKAIDDNKSTALKYKINELVREIDKCLAVLNK